MAQKTFLIDIDLNKNQLLNAVVQNLATAPSTSGLPQGFIYWNTTDKTAYIWTSTAWLDLGTVYTHPTYTGTGQPASALTGANVISRITLENGHVTGVTTRALTTTDIGAATSVHSHNFADILGLPSNTILANNTGTTGQAQALTVADLMTMMSIGYGSAAQLTAGTDTVQRTWSAKMLQDYVGERLNSYLTFVDLAIGTRTSTTMPITNSAGAGVTLLEATTALAGLFSAADKVKLNGIATDANNYIHPTANPGVHPFANEITTGVQILSRIVVNSEGHVTTIKGRDLTAADLAAVMINNTSNSATNQTWSASKIYSELQSAISQAQTGALQYKGEYNATTNTPNLATNSAIKIGWTYVVTGTGTFAGQDVESGDMIIARTDNPGSTAANWQIVNKNIPAIVSASTTVAGILMLASTAEAIAGTDNTKAITSLTLKAAMDARVGGFAANIGDGSTLNYTITHGLNTQDVTIQIQRVTDRVEVIAETAAPSTTTVTVKFNTAPTTGQYRVIIKK